MDVQEFEHLDRKLTGISKDLSLTREGMVAISAQSATKGDVSELKEGLAIMSHRVTSIEGSLVQLSEMQTAIGIIKDAQENCPALSQMEYDMRRKKEKIDSRKIMFTTATAFIAMITSVITLWQSAAFNTPKKIDKPAPPVLLAPPPKQPIPSPKIDENVPNH